VAKEYGSLIPIERIEGAIILLRGEKVMLDSDLAALYGVTTKQLNQAVKRNLDRFPADFMFQLQKEEADEVRSMIRTVSGSQSETSKRGANIKYRPYAFTEQGVAMLSSVLRSPRAVDVNIEIMRAFVRLRRLLGSNVELARKVAELEKKYDKQFAAVFEAIRQLMAPAKSDPPREMGYHTLVHKSDGKPSATRRRA